MRGASIGENIKVIYRDFEDQKNYDFEIDLNKISVRNEKPEFKIEITEDLHFRCGMKYKHYGIGGTSFNLKSVFE